MRHVNQNEYGNLHRRCRRRWWNDFRRVPVENPPRPVIKRLDLMRRYVVQWKRRGEDGRRVEGYLNLQPMSFYDLPSYPLIVLSNSDLLRSFHWEKNEQTKIKKKGKKRSRENKTFSLWKRLAIQNGWILSFFLNSFYFFFHFQPLIIVTSNVCVTVVDRFFPWFLLFFLSLFLFIEVEHSFQ